MNVHGCSKHECSLLCCNYAARSCDVLTGLSHAIQAGVLHIGGSDDGFARQRTAAERQGQEQQQLHSLQDAATVHATHPAVKLTLNASSCSDTAGRSGGHIHLAAESWLDRATAKARAKMAERSRS